MKQPEVAQVVVMSEGWLSVEEAMNRLSRSQRTVQKLAKAGRLKSKREAREGRTPETLYSAEDVERLRRQGPPVMAEPSRTVMTIAKASKPDAIDMFFQRIISLIDAPKPPELLAALARPVPVIAKMWLTLDEATAYSGLAKAKLRTAIAIGDLTARPDGPRRALIIKRADLERFAG